MLKGVLWGPESCGFKMGPPKPYFRRSSEACDVQCDALTFMISLSLLLFLFLFLSLGHHVMAVMQMSLQPLLPASHLSVEQGIIQNAWHRDILGFLMFLVTLYFPLSPHTHTHTRAHTHTHTHRYTHLYSKINRPQSH